MQDNELETIAAAMQEALHRAYALGRSDALRRVVEMVQSDELGSKTVALLAHSEPVLAAPAQAEADVHAGAAHGEPAHSDEMRQNGTHDGRTHDDATHGGGARGDGATAVITSEHDRRDEPKPPTSVKDFLLDYLYPLGAKK